MSINKTYLARLRKDTLAYAEKRRTVIKTSDDALHLSKRAIFAMHRENMAEAVQKMNDAEKLLSGLQKKNKNDLRVFSEGAYRAALEEYVEAALFYQFLKAGKLGEVKELTVGPNVYLAGLCDVPGELYRYAVKAATDGDVKTVKRCAAVAQEIVGELIECNLTKYLRNKFDQAKSAVQKLERTVYEVSLRQ